MATLAKMVTKTLDVGVSNTTIDLSATIKSFDVLDTKFIFGITSNQGLAINLSGATVKYIVEYYVEGKTYAIEGNCLVVDINTISFNLPDQLRGYNGKALIGIYATLTDGTKIDIKDIIVRVEPSIMDKNIDFSAKAYFKDFESIKAEVILEGEKAKTEIKAALPTLKTQINQLSESIDEKQNKIILHTNRLNPSNVNVDKQLNANNGELYDATGYTTSDYCDIVTGNDTGYFTSASFSNPLNKVDRLAFYDKHKNFISGIGSGSNTTEPVVIPQNAHYVRVSMFKYNANSAYVNVGTYKGFTKYKETEISDAIFNIENDKKVELLKNELIKTVKSGTVITTGTTPVAVDGTTNIDYVELTPKYDGKFAVYYRTVDSFATELLVPEKYVNSGQVIKALVNKELNKYGIAIRTFESEKSVDYSFYNVPSQNFDNVVQELSETKELVQTTSDILNDVMYDKVIGGSEKNCVGITTTFKIGDSNVFEHESLTLHR